MTAATRRRSSRSRPSLLRRAILVVLVLAVVGALLGAGAVATNAFGVGDKFDTLIGRIERIIWPPPPDRPTLPTVAVTPAPIRTPTPASSREPGATPGPTGTPLARVPVDMTIVDDPDAVFAHQLDHDWCAPAGLQMTLAVLGLGNTSPDFQREIAGRVREFETWDDSHNYNWGPSAMAAALAAYGAPGYEIRAYDFRGDALRDAALAIEETNSPAILIAWKGAHTWVMTGYRADADPKLFPDAVIEGTYILDPWYPWVSTLWGASDPPNTFQDLAEMKRNFLPWKRPEGAYPDRDGKWIILAPTQPAPNATR